MINYFSKYKFIFYISNFTLIFLYLYPDSLFGCIFYNDCKLQPKITRDFIFSANHFYAFVIFSIISFLTFIRSNRIKLYLYLIFLSIVLEILHYFIPERSFEFSDLFGNFFGVILIIILFYFFRKNEKFKNH